MGPDVVGPISGYPRISLFLIIQVLVRLIADYRIKLHAPLIGLVNRQIF